MKELVYTPSQIEGWDKFASFYLDPLQTVFKIKGAAGTGKSTLIKLILHKLPQLERMRRLVDPEFKSMPVYMTATTNQAALSLKEATGTTLPTGTIHSATKLRLIPIDGNFRKKRLIAKGDKIENALIFIDEASFVDQELLALIFKQTVNCKLVFIGDPNQLTPVESSFMPVFALGGDEVTLRELVRFDDGPITQMVSNFRDTVETGNWHKMVLAPGIIEHLPQKQFMAKAIQTMGMDGHRAKILAFHNDKVIEYNSYIAETLLGSAELKVGQRVVANKAANNGSDRLFANEQVLIEDITDSHWEGLPGKQYSLVNKKGNWFMLDNRDDLAKARRIAKTYEDGSWDVQRMIEDEWVDLRFEWACTVNKSQGSTYDTTFVDLSDISKGARTSDQLARLLYVGCGRTRGQLYLTGDIV